MSEWQLIDTAPKNPEGQDVGPYILVWNDFDHGIYEVRWSYRGRDDGWTPRAKLKDVLIRSNITHWMPKHERPHIEKD